MKRMLNWIQQSYCWLLRYYPPAFRKEYGQEMVSVFAQLSEDAAEQGALPLMWVCLREIRDNPIQVMEEYRDFLLDKVIRRIKMSEKKVWRIENKKTALWAAIPPVVVGSGIVLKELCLWPVYYQAPLWRLYLAVGLNLSATMVLITFGALAVLRRLPDWGYSWAGAGLMSGTLLLQIIVEEMAESGSQGAFSPAVNNILTILIFLMGLALLIAAAWRGWAQAGLVSIGFATTVGLNLFDAMSYAPFNRNDLGLLAGLSGLVMAAMIYVYARCGLQVRIGMLTGIWLLNLGASLLLIHVYQQNAISYGKPDPLIPLIIMLTGVIIAGPVIGVLGGRIRRRLAKA